LRCFSWQSCGYFLSLIPPRGRIPFEERVLSHPQGVFPVTALWPSREKIRPHFSLPLELLEGRPFFSPRPQEPFWKKFPFKKKSRSADPRGPPWCPPSGVCSSFFLTQPCPLPSPIRHTRLLQTQARLFFLISSPPPPPFPPDDPLRTRLPFYCPPFFFPASPSLLPLSDVERLPPSKGIGLSL